MDIKIDKIIRSKRRTVALVVMQDASLVIRAPLRAPLEYIYKFVDEKKDWIKKKQEHFLDKPDKYRPVQFVNGEIFYLTGISFKLEVISGAKPRIQINKTEGKLEITEAVLKHPRKYFSNWYKKHAKEIITNRVEWFAGCLGFKYKSITINSASSRWGSCGPRNTLNFSWRLVTAPMSVIDCVVVHELVHTEIKNHSHKFYARLGSILPDYKECEKWLKENSRIMSF